MLFLSYFTTAFHNFARNVEWQGENNDKKGKDQIRRAVAYFNAPIIKYFGCRMWQKTKGLSRDGWFQGRKFVIGTPLDMKRESKP